MDAVSTPARLARSCHRYDLRTLTYVALDAAKGGVIRNINSRGLALQVVAALRPRQIVHLLFDLPAPRLRVEAEGEVLWSNSFGQCGIRFLNLSPRTARSLNQWIFGNLLAAIPQRSSLGQMVLGNAGTTSHALEEDGLILSPAPLNVIPFQPLAPAAETAPRDETFTTLSARVQPDLDWLSQPLSGRSLALTVDSLIVIASWFVFALVFLSWTHELPPWPPGPAVGLGIALLVGALYWGFSCAFGGLSLGNALGATGWFGGLRR
jgi:hypothetical protein